MNRKTILLLVLFFSILLNIFFVLSDGLLEYKIWKIRRACDKQERVIRVEDASSITEQSFGFIKDGWYHYLPKGRGSVTENLMFNIFNIEGVSSYKAYDSSEELWLQIALYENAILRHDKELKKRIEKLFIDKIYGKEITALNHSTIGLLAIYLYKHTGELKYKEVADSVYGFLVQHDLKDYGCILSNDLAEVDENGMVVPFLCQYYRDFKEAKAYDIALKQINFYACNATDENTGLPYHAINLTPPIMRIGETNWGRGYAWWTIGVTPIINEDLNVESQRRIELMDSTLLRLWNIDRKFSTLVRQTNEIDLSATLPIIYYLVKKGLIKVDEELVDSFSIYLHDGLLYNCSGPKNGLALSNFYQPNPLAQAFYIFLINENLRRKQ